MRRTIVVQLVAALALTACAAAPESPPRSEMSRVTFDCDNGERVEMRFFPVHGVGVLVRHGETVELQQLPAGSGFLYSNGPITVRGKGDALTLEIGRMVPFQCKRAVDG